MDPGQFLTASRLHIVAGKGGVGKTAVTAVMAETAASLGLSVLVIDVEGRTAHPRLLGDEDQRETGEGEWVIRDGSSRSGRIEARSLSPDVALVEYLAASGVGSIAGQLRRLGVIDVVTNSTPGMSDILMLGKIKKLAREHPAEVIIVDAPASGHAITFLRAPSLLADSADSGAIRDQADEVLTLLRDPAKCQVTLVTLPEDTPVSETIETAYNIEDEVGIKLAPVVVNGVASSLSSNHAAWEKAVRHLESARHDRSRHLIDAASFMTRRATTHRDQIDRLHRALPLPQVHLGLVGGSGLDRVSIATLANEYRLGLTELADLTTLDSTVPAHD